MGFTLASPSGDNFYFFGPEAEPSALISGAKPQIPKLVDLEDFHNRPFDGLHASDFLAGQIVH